MPKKFPLSVVFQYLLLSQSFSSMLGIIEDLPVALSVMILQGGCSLMLGLSITHFCVIVYVSFRKLQPP